MTCDLIQLLEKRQSSLSKGHRRISDYIMKNYDKAAFMTANIMAQEVNVSESTVIRFASSLGYDGYSELQDDMIRAAHRKMTVIQRMEATMRLLDKNNATASVLRYDMDCIRTTSEKLDVEVFNNVIDKIISADKIYIIGLRSSATLAEFLGFYFNIIFDNVKVVNNTTTNDVSEQVLHINKNDLIIGISYPRYSRRTVQAMKFADSRGAHVIAITDNELSPLCSYAKQCLFADTYINSFVDSLVAPMSLLNALIVGVAVKKEKDITNVLREVESIWDENEIFDGKN